MAQTIPTSQRTSRQAARRSATALRAQVAGPVLFPDSDDFGVELSTFSTGLRHRPDLVVGATCRADVLAAASTAAEHGLTLSVLGTGHAPGPAIRGGLTVTTRRMSRVTIDADQRTATVGAGTTWGTVVDAAARQGLAAVCGSAPEVGAVGMSLGGGLGPLGRTFGYSADHVIALELISFDGRRRQVTATHNPDLFWALRGGKPNLGVVTEMTVNLQPVASFYGGQLIFSSPDIAALVRGYQFWLSQDNVPDELTTSIAVLRLPDSPTAPPLLRGRTVAALRVGFVGPESDGPTAIAPLLSTIGCKPAAGTLARFPYRHIGSIHDDPTRPSHHRSAGLLLHAFDTQAADTLLHLAGPHVNTPLSIVELRHLGGAYAPGTNRCGAVSGRDALLNLWVSSRSLPPSAPAEAEAAAQKAVRCVIDGLRPWSNGGAQANFLGTENSAADRELGLSEAQSLRLRSIQRRNGPPA